MPVLIVCAIGLLVLPLPPWALDGLISVNICFGIGLLVYSLNVKSPSNLSTFPSLLLFTTVFRIALNVATARQILLVGDAGHIVEAFGRWVVGGNIVVGLVIFFIIALVQFIVIAKGAERVAEVAARFTLDALPGKQVSIDSDLRSGLLTQDQARNARTMLGVESQMFGAMDGAMKFVKGDVIAGMVIVLINLLGGIAIGVVYFGLSAGEAANKYAVLSVGDGLVSQIPALLISMAAGILVTRATNEDGAPHLGGQIGGQLLSHPKAMVLTGGMTLLFCLVPELPWLAFLIVGGAVTSTGVVLLRQMNARATAWNPQSSAPVRDGSPERRPMLVDADSIDYAPILLELSPQLVATLSPSQFEHELLLVRKRMHKDIGLPFPGIVIRQLKEAKGMECCLWLHDVPKVRLEIPAQKSLAIASQQQLAAAGIQVAADALAYGGSAWLAEEQTASARNSGIEVLSTAPAISWLVEAFIRDHTHELLNIEDVQSIVARAKQSWPELSNQVGSAVPITRLTRVLKNLLRERVSIRDIPTIFQALIYASQLPNDDVSLTEAARKALGASLCFKLTQGTNRLDAVMISPQIEEILRGAINHSVDGPVLSLNPEQIQQMQDALGGALVSATNSQPSLPPVRTVLTAPDLRWHIHLLVMDKLPGVAVVSTEEVPATVKVEVRGMIEGGAGE
ncbi:flagellar biosynthesis protein FlhA [Noviherbaspirillum humi]|uniref:flagellar biosynthesis protein FlhA n=1 Tax=Noviherbaspirillum humi TaxID=1688639 RepID=UPI0015961D4D|nr:flagellar biosynthesis protein FlhA [Noviherbaspirillum humi]